MQQELYKSQFLTLAEHYHVKSVHAEWDGKKAEAQRYGRLCADQYLKALDDNIPEDQKVMVYWRAILQHHDVRRNKTALTLATSALQLIGDNQSLVQHKPMFEAYLTQNA